MFSHLSLGPFPELFIGSVIFTSYHHALFPEIHLWNGFSLFLIEIKLTYNIALVLGVQQ